MLAIGISYAIATWASFFLGAPLIFSVLCAVVGALFFLLRRSARTAQVVFLSASIAFAAYEVYYIRTIQPLHGAEGREVIVQGVVTSVDQRRLPSYTLMVQASFPQDNLPDANLRIRGWGDLYFQPGDGIRARLQLEELRGSPIYHNSRGVFMGARLLESESFDELAGSERFQRFFLRRRAAATTNIAYNIPTENGALVAGITLGELSGVDPALSSALSRSGIIHLAVVSGMHLSILVGLITELPKRLGAGKRISSLLGIFAAVGFAFLVGISPSIIRALVMMLVYITAGMLSRRSDSLNSLGFALLLICVFAPHWMLDRGLWLSFGSTAGIILWSGPMIDRIKARYANERLPTRILANTLLGAGAITLSAYVFSMPVMIVTAGWLSLVSPIVNILVAPLVVPALICGVISAFFTGVWVAPFAFVADLCAGLIADIALTAASLPFATFALNEFWMLLWFLLAAGMAGYLLYRKAGKDHWKYAVTLLTLAFAVGSLSLGISNRGKVEVAAIEGSSSIVLIREGSAVVVGTPTVFEFNRLTRYLDYRGVTHLDAVIAYDAGEQISSALIRLVDDYNAALVIGPDDDYILNQMSRALVNTEVLSGGYATINVLGGVNIRPSLTSRQVEIQIGRVNIVKSGEEHPVMEATNPNLVRIWPDGVMVWTRNTPPAFEPLGAVIFGERRLVLNL